MQFHQRGLDRLVLDASAVTIGSFDGVHSGHQILFHQLTSFARAHSLPSVVVTFFPHPVVLLREVKDPYYLTLPEEKARILKTLGIDHVVTIEFTRELSAFSPWQFMDRLNRHLKIKHLFVGKDFALGKDRQGNPETLAEIGQRMGYQVTIVPFKEDAGGRVSSSRIRRALNEGDIAEANTLLGRPYAVPVEIVPESDPNAGERLRPIQVNLACDPMQLLPCPGLYSAAWDETLLQTFPVFVRAIENRDLSCVIAWLPDDAANRINESLARRLVFLSRMQEMPRQLSGGESIAKEMWASMNGERHDR